MEPEDKGNQADGHAVPGEVGDMCKRCRMNRIFSGAMSLFVIGLLVASCVGMYLSFQDYTEQVDNNQSWDIERMNYMQYYIKWVESKTANDPIMTGFIHTAGNLSVTLEPTFSGDYCFLWLDQGDQGTTSGFIMSPSSVVAIVWGDGTHETMNTTGTINHTYGQGRFPLSLHHIPGDGFEPVTSWNFLVSCEPGGGL